MPQANTCSYDTQMRRQEDGAERAPSYCLKCDRKRQITGLLETVRVRVGREARQVVDAQLLELYDHGAQVGAQDLRVRLLLQVLLEAGLRVQPEALARLRAPRAARALVRAGLRARPGPASHAARARLHFPQRSVRTVHAWLTYLVKNKQSSLNTTSRMCVQCSRLQARRC